MTPYLHWVAVASSMITGVRWETRNWLDAAKGSARHGRNELEQTMKNKKEIRC